MKTDANIQEKVILIRISKLYHDSMTTQELYEATRGVWKVGSRRNEADFAFTVANGDIIEVYRINLWLPAGTMHYSTRPRDDIEVEDRWEFYGELAEEDIRNEYIGKSVKQYLAPGAANPVIYINC